MSPRTNDQFKEIREESKAKILDAALRVFAKKGYDSASISMIAKDAGVSKGLMYNYFESKEKLLKGVVYKAFETAAPIFEEFMKQTTAQSKMRALIEASFDYMCKNKEYNRLLTALSIHGDSIDFIKDIAARKILEMENLVKPILSELGYNNAHIELNALGAIFDGVALRYLVTNDEKYLEEMKVYLIDRYVNGNLK